MKRTFTFTVAAALLGMLAYSGGVFAAKGGIPGPPTGGETANNLSFPAIQTESVNSTPANWNRPAAPELGVHYSYGCDLKEMNGAFSYPNTSCVDNLDAPTVYYTDEECTASGAPCDGLEVSRIYWQKVDVNEWWADDDGIFPDLAYVAYVDWGDALEAVSWTSRSKIRVETQPYTNLAGPGLITITDVQAVDENGDLLFYDKDKTLPVYLNELGACSEWVLPPTDCKVGFQQWHVSGQGITEHWGVRADETGTSYNYDSPFQIIKTGTAMLNIAKMEAGDAECRSPGEGDEGSDPPIRDTWTASGWGDTCTVHDDPYTMETSVGGKYVYGYNLDMKAIDMLGCGPGWLKTGWWRLTFYTTGDAVVFDDADIPTNAPPAVPAEVRTVPRAEGDYINAVSTFAPSLGELYFPVVDVDNNLTYLDICIVAKDQGGGGGSGGGGGTGGGKPGDTSGAGGGKGQGGGSGKKGR